MKLVTLNVWGGNLHNRLFSFVQRLGADTDLFCFQEMHHEGTGKFEFDPREHPEIFLEFQKVLPNHEGYFHPHFRDFFGLATFVRRSVTVSHVIDEFVYRQRGYEPEGDIGHHARNVQIATCALSGKRFHVLNFHGLWNGKGKTDTLDRLEQSRRIIKAIKRLDGPMILCGDFNLEPHTESLAMLEGCGLRNLVKEYGVMSTRTSFYTKPGKFADYILVSEGIDVRSFRVLPEEVSDHAALELEFDLK